MARAWRRHSASAASKASSQGFQRAEAASDGPGFGSTFTVWLPALSADAPISNPPPEPAPTPRSSGRRVLVVDDASFLRDRSRFNARAAGILGFSNFGRDHLYLLDENLQPDWDALQQWLQTHPDEPVLLFGFTFIV